MSQMDGDLDVSASFTNCWCDLLIEADNNRCAGLYAMVIGDHSFLIYDF